MRVAAEATKLRAQGMTSSISAPASPISDARQHQAGGEARIDKTSPSTRPSGHAS